MKIKKCISNRRVSSSVHCRNSIPCVEVADLDPKPEVLRGNDADASVRGTDGHARRVERNVCGFSEQLSRITVRTGDVSRLQEVFSSKRSIIMSYDIVAVAPTSEKVFQHACSVLDVDIISLSFCQRLDFKMKHLYVEKAVKRGVVFEVVFGEFVGTSNRANRQQFLANVQALALATNGKGVIFSSGAEHSYQLRGPLDVVNLASCMGFKEQDAYNAISSTPATVLANARRRKAYKGKLIIEVG